MDPTDITTDTHKSSNGWGKSGSKGRGLRESIDEEVSLLDASERKAWALPSRSWEAAENCSKLGEHLFCSVPLVADKNLTAVGKCRVAEISPLQIAVANYQLPVFSRWVFSIVLKTPNS